MDKLELFYPVSPYHLNQPFGSDPAYYSKFKDRFGKPLKGHSGCDLMAVHGQPIYASIDGLAFYDKDEHGGEGVRIVTTEPRKYPKGVAWFEVIQWHMIGDTDPKFPPPLPMGAVKTRVKVGDLIGYADNTGFPYESYGDHCHYGLFPVDETGNAVEPGNGFNGAIDPVPFFTQFYATDAATVKTKLLLVIQLLRKALGIS